MGPRPQRGETPARRWSAASARARRLARASRSRSPSTRAHCTSSTRRRDLASTTERKDTHEAPALDPPRTACSPSCSSSGRVAATTKKGAGGQPPQRRRHESVSGSISVIGVWTGPEQESFQAVIDGFKEQNPDVTVKYTSGGDNIVTVLSTAVEGGNPPDIATVSQPGTMADFAKRGALKPLDFAADAVAENFGDSIVDDGQRRRHALRPPLQGGQQVDRLVQRRRLRGRRRRSSGDLGRPARGREDDQRVRSARLLDRRRGRLDAHRPVREHLHPHGGRGDVRQARRSTRSPGPTSRSRTR